MSKHTIEYYNKRKQYWSMEDITEKCYEDFAEKELKWYTDKDEYVEEILNKNGIFPEGDSSLISYIAGEIFKNEYNKHNEELNKNLLKYYKRDPEEEKILSQCKKVISFKDWLQEENYASTFIEKLERIFNMKIA